MELDKRIKTITDILTVVNSDLKGIIGKTGYFGNSIMDFKRLDTCEHGELTGIIRNTDRCFEYENCADSGRQGYCYFIPEYYLNPVEPEKKYRAFSLNEFSELYAIGDVVTYRIKDCEVVEQSMLIGFQSSDDEDIPGDGYVLIGNCRYSLKELFNNYELNYQNKWQPFGVIEDD